MPVKRHSIILLVFLVLACGPPKSQEHPVEISYSGSGFREGDQVRFMRAGEVIPTRVTESKSEGLVGTRITAEFGAVRFNAIDYLNLRPDLDLSLQFLAPCGWKEIPLQIASVRIEELNNYKGSSVSLKAEPSDLRFSVKRFTLVVDNREAPATTISVGEASFPVKQNEIQRFDTIAPDCAEGVQIRAGDKPIATLASDESGKWGGVLIDPGGRHCYTYRFVGYGAEPSRPAANLQPATVHYLSWLGNATLLEPAPQSRRVKMPPGMQAFDIIPELMPAKCRGEGPTR